MFSQEFSEDGRGLRWEEALAIWMRKIRMLKQISGVNEFHSPLPLLRFRLSLETDTWDELVKWQSVSKASQEARLTPLQTAGLVTRSR